MTLEEKVGQMMQVDQRSLKSPEDVATYHLGSLLGGGGSGPRDPKESNLKVWSGPHRGIPADRPRHPPRPPNPQFAYGFG